MKKLSKFLTVVLAAGTLAACGNGAKDKADDTKVDEPAVEETVKDPAADETVKDPAADDATDAAADDATDPAADDAADDNQ